ncbi:MAG: ParM/StbA family protein [Thermaerobacter sp.]|nr:ParM/StbA family protein [Thermaerobacter sp.]
MLPERIAIDCGHGFTKALSTGGRRLVFPSLICAQPTALDLGEFAPSQSVSIGGIPYLVGEPARKHATPLWSREKAGDPDTLRLILVAAARLGAVGPVQVATGLPLAWYGSQRRTFREALTGFGAPIALPGQPPQRLWIESAVVLPQGVAAAGPVLAAPDYEPGQYLIVDVGYRTTDYLVVEKTPAGDLAFAADSAGSIELGMHAVSQFVAHALSEQYHVPFTPEEIEAGPCVAIRGQKVDVSQRLRQARETVGRQLARRLAAELDAALEKLLGIVVVGGGSDLLTGILPGAITPPDPQWANAVGYGMALNH